MPKYFESTVRSPFFWGVFTLILLLIFSLSLRQQDFKRVTGAQNLEATYHVLLTVTALNESPAKNHWYLPTVSLGRESDKHIPWGATVPTKTGDYIYTSFTPLGFLAPYFWFKAFNLEPSVENLAHFNFFLGSLSTFALFLLLVGLLKFNGYGPWISVGAALVGSTIGIFSREALLSNGVIYWSQNLYQTILIFSLYLIFRWLTSETKESRRLYSAAIIVAAFVGPLIEWTGYVFNVGLIFLLWLNCRDSVSSKVLVIQIVIATAIAGILTVMHFSLAVGFGPAIEALLGRFIARNTSVGSVVELIQGYGLSYGMFILTIFSILTLAYFGSRQQVADNRQKATFFIFVATCIPLLENIVMLQHATQFSFDRLKFIFPASLILAFSFAQFEIKGRVVLLALILLSSFHGYKSYKADMSGYSSWGTIDTENRKLASRISDEVDVGCAVFSSNIGVRAYTNLLFHRGVYEHKFIQEASSLMAERNACASVFLEGAKAFPALPKYTTAIVTRNDGSTTVIKSNGGFLETPEVVDGSFFLTDNNWLHGISRKWAGFFVPNAQKFADEYKAGRLVKFANGETREIIRADPSGLYLNIYLNGDLLNPEKVGLPTKFVVMDKAGYNPKEGKK